MEAQMSKQTENATDEAYLDDSNPTDKIVFYALEEAQQKLEQNGEFEPFTVVLHNDDLYVESHPGEDAVACFKSAKQTITEMTTLADAYAFAYDGYVQTDDGDLDALIVERGIKGALTAEAFAIIYIIDQSGEGSLEFEEGIYNLGQASSLYGDDDFSADQLEEH
jgi:hypothetical protein